jgi:hypothetical protein
MSAHGEGPRSAGIDAARIRSAADAHCMMLTRPATEAAE